MSRNARKTRSGIYVKRVLIEVPEDVMLLAKVFLKFEGKKVSKMITRFLEEYVLRKSEDFKQRVLSVAGSDLDTFYKEHDEIIAVLKVIEEKKRE